MCVCVCVCRSVGASHHIRLSVSNGNAQNAVDVFDASTGLVTALTTGLSIPRYFVAAASVGNLAIFAGGYVNAALTTVDIYDVSAGTWTVSDFRIAARFRHAAAALGNSAYFGFGFAAPSTFFDTIEIYTLGGTNGPLPTTAAPVATTAAPASSGNNPTTPTPTATTTVAAATGAATTASGAERTAVSALAVALSAAFAALGC